jgi:hypothetical protein
MDRIIADHRYHSNEVLLTLRQWEVRAYCSEPKRGRHNWKDKAAERDAVYQNRRRIRGERGRSASAGKRWSEASRICT